MSAETVLGPDGPDFPDRAPRTALRLEGGLPRHPRAHGARLASALEALGSDPRWLEARLEEAWAWARREAAGTGPDTSAWALRLTADPRAPRLRVRLEALPETPAPYRLVPLTHPLDPTSPLAPHKGCLGSWGARVLAEARRQGAHDALLCWPDGTVAETAIAAVGVLVGHRLHLPPVTGRVRSLSELLDLPTWADERGWEMVFSAMSLDTARRGQPWCFNALRGLWPAEFAEPHP